MERAPFSPDHGVLFKALVRAWHRAQAPTITLIQSSGGSSPVDDLFFFFPDIDDSRRACQDATLDLRQDFWKALRRNPKGDPTNLRFDLMPLGLDLALKMESSCLLTASDLFASATIERTYTFDWPTSHHQQLQLLTWAYD